jgi:hypothetical protein
MTKTFREANDDSEVFIQTSLGDCFAIPNGGGFKLKSPNPPAESLRAFLFFRYA